MVKRAPDDRQIALVERQQPVLDVTVRRARAQVQHLEVPMPVRAHLVAVVYRQEQHVHGARRFEWPDVNSLRVDLRLYQVKIIPTRPLGELNAAGKTTAFLRRWLR